MKDLVVDMEPFFQAYREVMPFLITDGPRADPRAPAVAEDRERFDDTTKCILCAACTTSCPVFWTDGQYFGPAAIVNAHRFIFDSPRRGRPSSAWRSSTTRRACGAAAPPSTAPRPARAASRSRKAIQEVKRALITRRF